MVRCHEKRFLWDMLRKKDIILNQEELSDKNIIVIPTKNTPQGFTALVNFNADASVEENEQALMITSI